MSNSEEKTIIVSNICQTHSMHSTFEIKIYVALSQKHKYLGRERAPKPFLVVQWKEF